MYETIIKIILAGIFSLSVLGKFTGKTKETFENAGFSPKLMYTIAIAEIIFTVGLFTKYEFISTICLLGIMGGAFLTLFRQRVALSKYTLALITSLLLIAMLVLQIS